MINAAELQLRKIALALTALLVLLLVYSGLRLWLSSGPESIPPAASSLQVEGIPIDGESDGTGADLLSRPLFWQGRKPHVEVATDEPVERPVRRENAAIKDVRLLGVYAAGQNSGIIIAHRGERMRVRLNEEVGGWTFTMMSGDGAIFEKDSESRVLHLEHANVKGAGGRGNTVRPSAANRAQASSRAKRQSPRTRALQQARAKAEEKRRRRAEAESGEDQVADNESGKDSDKKGE